jgi:hypothetical protein
MVIKNKCSFSRLYNVRLYQNEGENTVNRPESINNSSDFHQSYLHSFLVINHDLSENNVGTYKLSKSKLPINGDELEALIEKAVKNQMTKYEIPKFEKKLFIPCSEFLKTYYNIKNRYTLKLVFKLSITFLPSIFTIKNY